MSLFSKVKNGIGGVLKVGAVCVITGCAARGAYDFISDYKTYKNTEMKNQEDQEDSIVREDVNSHPEKNPTGNIRENIDVSNITGDHGTDEIELE